MQVNSVLAPNLSMQGGPSLLTGTWAAIQPTAAPGSRGQPGALGWAVLNQLSPPGLGARVGTEQGTGQLRGQSCQHPSPLGTGESHHRVGTGSGHSERFGPMVLLPALPSPAPQDTFTILALHSVQERLPQSSRGTCLGDSEFPLKPKEHRAADPCAQDFCSGGQVGRVPWSKWKPGCDQPRHWLWAPEPVLCCLPCTKLPAQDTLHVESNG